MAFKFEIFRADGRSCCKSNDINMLCPHCQPKAKAQMAASKAASGANKAKKPAVKPAIRSNRPALKVANAKASTHGRTHGRITSQRRKFLASYGVKLVDKAAMAPMSNKTQSAQTDNNVSIISISDSRKEPEASTMSIPRQNFQLNISEDVQRQLREQIDNNVTIRFAAYKARNTRKAPDPWGTAAQLEAARDSQVRAQIEEEEYQKIYGPMYAYAAKVANGGNTPKIKEMPDPLGLRTHGLNPDGSPYLADVNDSNPFNRPATERLNLDTGNPGKGKRD